MSKNLCLGKLRRICGLTQSRLAEKIGVSTPAIIGAENGTRPLSDENARRIMFATGVLPRSLVSESSPIALDGKQYTEAHWELWRKSKNPAVSKPSMWEELLETQIQMTFDDLLRAASDSKRIVLAAEEFRKMLANLFKDPGIKRRYSALSEDSGSPPSPEALGSSILGLFLCDTADLGLVSRSRGQMEDPFAALPRGEIDDAID